MMSGFQYETKTETRWERTFAGSEDILEGLADEALEAHTRG